jgi:arylsulfatase A-like enzyme
VKAGQVMNELVSLVDLPATWLNLAGATVPTAFEGRSMAPLLSGAAHRQRRFVFTERNWHDTWEPARGVVSDRYSLIVNYRPEVAYRGTLDHIWTSWSRGGGPVFDEIVKERQAGRLRPELECYFRKPRPVVEMYDLERDPDEFANLAEVKEMAATRGEMLTALDEWMQATNDFLPTPNQRFMSSAGDDPGLERLLNGYLPI